ncbi:short-chain dehydrogenase [Anopheles sinensis]|uniref:Short-chain dehydrogenase n=1 Tax=Anopheles sinensis TaxID=74873 RepID=A0A084VG53_ANOSI|nr:short-chain dehydrogenase [Anopheles sinensis]
MQRYLPAANHPLPLQCPSGIQCQFSVHFGRAYADAQHSSQGSVEHTDTSGTSVAFCLILPINIPTASGGWFRIGRWKHENHPGSTRTSVMVIGWKSLVNAPGRFGLGWSCRNRNETNCQCNEFPWPPERTRHSVHFARDGKPE